MERMRLRAGLPRAKISTKQSPKRLFGRSDWADFDYLPVISAGCRDIGPVKVDCKLRLSESQCGIHTDYGRPAAVLYMDLAFDQPADCKLSEATVHIRLEDGPEVSTGIRPPQEPSDWGVRLTDYLGPVSLHGRITKVGEKKAVQWMPHLDGGGMVGFGGLGTEKERSIQHKRRWLFNGNMVCPTGSRRGGNGEYTELCWKLQENHFECQSLRRKVFQTAFAFEHSIRPFVMMVSIDGRLQKRSHRVRHLHFPQALKKSDGAMATYVDLGEYYDMQREANRTRLDPLFQRLHVDLERRNKEKMGDELDDTSVGHSAERDDVGTSHEVVHPEMEPHHDPQLAGLETMRRELTAGSSDTLPPTRQRRPVAETPLITVVSDNPPTASLTVSGILVQLHSTKTFLRYLLTFFVVLHRVVRRTLYTASDSLVPGVRAVVRAVRTGPITGSRWLFTIGTRHNETRPITHEDRDGVEFESPLVPRTDGKDRSYIRSLAMTPPPIAQRTYQPSTTRIQQQSSPRARRPITPPPPRTGMLSPRLVPSPPPPPRPAEHMSTARHVKPTTRRTTVRARGKSGVKGKEYSLLRKINEGIEKLLSQDVKNVQGGKDVTPKWLNAGNVRINIGPSKKVGRGSGAEVKRDGPLQPRQTLEERWAESEQREKNGEDRGDRREKKDEMVHGDTLEKKTHDTRPEKVEKIREENEDGTDQWNHDTKEKGETRGAECESERLQGSRRGNGWLQEKKERMPRQVILQTGHKSGANDLDQKNPPPISNGTTMVNGVDDLVSHGGETTDEWTISASRRRRHVNKGKYDGRETCE
jgi:hypothetical protein